ncbi:MAG: HAMP domain-containing histidine kinase [Deltaproteobacteria bacterium]|nr:HAMP domain-containing histidine kinase [Deltaproteobacteria bacterium]
MQTIRSRLIIIFFVCLSFTGGLTVFYYYNIFILEKKLLLIEQFDDLKDNILELRRYEKNYFLTGKSVHLEQMDHYLLKTEASFLRLGKKIKGILPLPELEDCSAALRKYRRILKNKNSIGDKDGPKAAELRSNGTILTSFSERLIIEKRSRVTRVLRQMLLLPLAFSAGFILLVIFVMHMTREDVLKPLSLIQNAAENARKGVFEPIDHAVQKKNEVSQCIAAFNKMVVEIDAGQEQLLQSRKMASIGTFTSGIAHELNNPINNISLIVDSLLEDGASLSAKECRELYKDLMDQADRSSGIVKNLLEFSRTDQDQFENISMKEMIEKTRRLLKNELSIKGVKFHARIQENLPKLWIDKSRLQQALVNLLLNSIHAMPDGGDLTVIIEVDPGSENLRIDVKDTGTGIPKGQLDSIFDPFFTTKKEGEGTGLGLSVTYNIIKRHNGKISVESMPGKGTCFSIFLPVKV